MSIRGIRGNLFCGLGSLIIQRTTGWCPHQPEFGNRWLGVGLWELVAAINMCVHPIDLWRYLPQLFADATRIVNGMPLPTALFLSVNGDMTDICEASVSHKVLHGWLLCLGLCAAGNVCQLRRNLVL